MKCNQNVNHVKTLQRSANEYVAGGHRINRRSDQQKYIPSESSKGIADLSLITCNNIPVDVTHHIQDISQSMDLGITHNGCFHFKKNEHCLLKKDGVAKWF